MGPPWRVCAERCELEAPRHHNSCMHEEPMIRRLLATATLAIALPAIAQTQAVPAANYTDLWYNPAESGWGVTITQHSPPARPNSQTYPIWYTHDPPPSHPPTPPTLHPLSITLP